MAAADRCVAAMRDKTDGRRHSDRTGSAGVVVTLIAPRRWWSHWIRY
jgi:hypothetical protein